MKPSNDREAVTLILDGLVEKGWSVIEVADDTYNTNEREEVSTVAEAVDLVMGVDEAYVFLQKSPKRIQYIFFVLGNDPEEVACDYTVGLDPDLSNITDPWWN